MRRIAVLVTVVVTLVYGLIPAARSAEQVRGYIYDEFGDDGALHNLAIVINVTKRWVDIQGKERARIDSMSGNFGGEYEDCGNEAFYCLTGLFEIVIPKTKKPLIP